MMGRQEAAPELFYDFRLDEHVPADHMLRGIDRFLDLSALRAKLAPFYSSIARRGKVEITRFVRPHLRVVSRERFSCFERVGMAFGASGSAQVWLGSHYK
jgi:hypothetical protein